MSENDKTEHYHKVRMARKKAQIDASIARADGEKGLILVLTGNGKGKSSSAFGMVGRALGHGMKVGVCQFIKSRISDTVSANSRNSASAERPVTTTCCISGFSLTVFSTISLSKYL